MSLLATFLFPMTSVSFYCDEAAFTEEGLDMLFNKMFYAMVPFGIGCILVTGEGSSIGSYYSSLG